MKLKKSLLALTTAATVAVAGTATAVAEDANPANGSSLSDNQTSENGEGKDNNQDQSKLAGSADKFFGWKNDTSGLEKMKSVVTLITTIGALVAGVVTLAANFGKIQNLIK